MDCPSTSHNNYYFYSIDQNLIKLTHNNHLMGLNQNCAQGHFFVIFIGTCPYSQYNLHAYFFQSHNMFASDVLNSNQFKSYLSVFNMFMNFMKCQMMWKFESIALPLYVAYHLYPIRLQWSLLVMIMAGIVPLFYSHIHRYFMLILEQLHPQSGHMLTPHSLWHFKVCQRLSGKSRDCAHR